MTGLAAAPTLAGRVVHSDVPRCSTFRCSEPLFERYDAAMRRTVVNNLHGIPTDTPTYEKNGWTGDAQVGAPSMLAEFGMAKFFTKWLGDLADSQDTRGPAAGDRAERRLGLPRARARSGVDDGVPVRAAGDVPDLRRRPAAARSTGRCSPVTWTGRSAGCATGSRSPRSATTCRPDSGGIPPEDTRLTATAYLYRALLHTAELGDVIGTPVPRYREVAANLLTAFNAAFLDPGGHYRTAKDPGYRQTSNAVPLAFGMVPAGSVAAVANRLAAEMRANGNHVNVGCLGASVLLAGVDRQRARRRRARHRHRTRAIPSWGHWFDNGADTMWEMWDTGTRSRNHYFKGTVAQWLYEHVAGSASGRRRLPDVHGAAGRHQARVVGPAGVHERAWPYLRGVEQGRRRAQADRRGAGRFHGGSARAGEGRVLGGVGAAWALDLHRGRHRNRAEHVFHPVVIRSRLM